MSSPNLSDSARRTANDLRSQAEDLKSTAQQKAGAAMHSAQQFGSDVKHAVQDKFEGNARDRIAIHGARQVDGLRHAQFARGSHSQAAVELDAHRRRNRLRAGFLVHAAIE